MLNLFLLCACGGAMIGVLNGMLGVGGTFIVIPLLEIVALNMGVPPAMAHVMAVGTAPSTVLFTCIASFLAHKRLGSMRGNLLRQMAPAFFLGAAAGTFLAPHMPTTLLKLLFVTIVSIMGVHMLFPGKKDETGGREDLRHMIPISLFFGMLASMTGLAGTLLTVTWLNRRGVPWAQAAGTGAGIGLVIAVTALTGYICSGWGLADLPEWSLGYVYLPGTLCLIVPSMFTARVGAILINRKDMPIALFKRGVGLLNLLVAAHVVWTVL